jgi:hypothetical protein
MKTSAIIRIMAGLVLLAFTTAPLRAQNESYTNLTVSESTTLATLDVSGTSATFGTWGSGQALTLNLPGGTGTQQINFIASGTSTAWQ